MCLAYKLRALRLESGFKTAKDFAGKIEISYNAYRNYKNPNYQCLPNLQYLLKIADYFQISLDSLLDRQVPKKDAFLIEKTF
jgi:transcriptional regulator with XRE-family HTH domain